MWNRLYLQRFLYCKWRKIQSRWTIEEARAFKTYFGAQIALDTLEDANVCNNINDCEIVEVIA